MAGEQHGGIRREHFGVEAWLGRRTLWLGALLAIVLGGLTIRRNLDYRTGEAIWSDTVAKRPGNARAYGSLGRAYIEAGRWQEAIAACTEELKTDPDYRGDAHVNLGRALTELGRPAEALPCFTEAEVNWGRSLAEANRAAEALPHFERALQLSPGARADEELAGTLAAAGRTGEAIPHYEAALRLQPNDAPAHYGLGNAFARLERFAEAISHYDAAVRLQPDFAEAREHLAWLRQQ